MLLKEPILQTDKIFVGVVVDNKDPARMQRVRVKLPQHPSNLEDKDIPWSVPEKSGLFGSGNGLGTLAVPIEGSFVSVRMCPDQYSTVYTQIQTITDVDISSGYPNAYGFKDANGNRISMDLVNKLLKVLMNSDVQISQSGDVKIKLNGNLHLYCKGLFMQSGDINITSDDITTNAPVHAASLDAYDVTTINLSASSAKVRGSFQGSLNGGSSFASIATGIQGDYPEVICPKPAVDKPVAPDLDFKG